LALEGLRLRAVTAGDAAAEGNLSERLASSLIREAIGIDAAQVKDRFGFAA
jgi:hypothetical protein